MNGAYVSVTKRGKGKPVLFLHGYLSCKESFYYQISALEEAGYLAVAPDMPSFGASGRITTPWSVGDYADWLESFINACDIRGADVVAHSFGARVALKLFSEKPELCGKLLITGGAGIVKPRTPQYIKKVKRYRRVKKLFPRYAEKRFGSEEYRTLSPLMRESYKKIVNEDLRSSAAKIKSETLLIYGRQDTVTPADEEGAAFNKLISNSRFKIIDGGHFCFSDNGAEFNSLMLGFFKDK